MCDDKFRAELMIKPRLTSRHVRLRVYSISNHAPSYVRQNRLHVRIVQTEHDTTVKRHPIDEARKTITDFRQPPSKVIQMLAVDIGHDRQNRRKHQKRTIAFI